MLDWDDLRFFLAIARHRTLAAAAKQLQVTQSTVGRRLASLQAGMGVRLLQRTADGYALTLAGKRILEHVERVEVEARSVEHAVAGHDVRLEGLVRISASQLVTTHLLASCFAAMHARHRGIQIESHPVLPGEPLATHDADISVRLKRFEHHELIARNIGSIAFGLYACADYLERSGVPDLDSGCSGHQLITLLDEQDHPLQSAWLSTHAGRAQVVLKADTYETQHRVAHSGGGLALLPRFRADPEPALRRIATPAPVPASEIWLGVHREKRTTPRVRIVLDFIAEAVRAQTGRLNPAEPEGGDA